MSIKESFTDSIMGLNLNVLLDLSTNINTQLKKPELNTVDVPRKKTTTGTVYSLCWSSKR